MKILVISDKVVPRLYDVSIAERYADVDLVLSCGDLPKYYLEFIVTVLNVPLFYVSGNHDPDASRRQYGMNRMESFDWRNARAPGGCINIDGQVVRYKGVLIAGLEGSMRYKPGPHQYTQAEMHYKALRLGARLLPNRVLYGRWLDILITHSAPLGIHDGEDRCHTGFQAFLSFMSRYHPQYLIHGHSHVYDRRQPTMTRYGDTLVVNAYPYRIVEIQVPKQGVVRATPSGRH